MPDLLNLQCQFQNYLLANQMAVQQSIVNTEKVSALKRLNIYQDAYRARLLETLASNYPILNRYLGCQAFQKIGDAYIDQYPSPFRSIRWFGDKLPDYLKEDEENSYPYLSELAQFEWTLTLAFDAADEELVALEQMATIPPESWAKMRFITHPSVHCMHFNWNIVAIWQALSKEETPPDPVKSEQPMPWLIWRYDYKSRFSSLVEDEAWAINTLQQGASFGELCAGLCEWVSEEEVGLRAASLLKGWIQSDLLTKIIL